MKISSIAISIIATTLLTIGLSANTQNNQSNPLLGTWVFVSCAPVEKNPCADHTTSTSKFSKLIFKSKHMEFADGDVLPIRYIIEDGEVIVDSDGTFNWLCCTSRKADEITPAPDAAMPWHPRAPCSGARVA